MKTLTVLCATYNRAESLRQTLHRLLAQRTNGAFTYEIMVIDNNSTDNTKDVVAALQRKDGAGLRYLFEPKQGKSHALNSGIASSSADILVFTDDDVLPEENWLFNLVSCFENVRCDGLGGRILPDYPPKAPRWLTANVDLLAGPIVTYDYGEHIKPFAKPMLEFLGANMAFRRRLFEAHGLFRTDIGPGTGVLGEDTEITNRFQRAGAALYYCGQAAVKHPVDPTRMTWSYIGRWFAAAGRCRVIVDDHNAIPRQVAYWNGVPRYLLRQILEKSVSLVCAMPNERAFVKAWVDLTTAFGKAQQSRRIFQQQHHPRGRT